MNKNVYHIAFNHLSGYFIIDEPFDVGSRFDCLDTIWCVESIDPNVIIPTIKVREDVGYSGHAIPLRENYGRTGIIYRVDRFEEEKLAVALQVRNDQRDSFY